MTSQFPRAERAMAAFCQERDYAYSRVIDRRPYVDTVQFSLRAPLPGGARVELLELGAGGVEFRRSEKNWQRRFVVRIHQPTTGALNLMAMLAPDYVINRVDIALDFAVSELATAEKLQTFLRKHLTQRWHGNFHVHEEEETTIYFRPSWRRRNIAFYPEEVSRHDTWPVLHLELRHYGMAACRRIGIQTIADVEAVDFYAIAARECRLSFVDTEKVACRIERMVDRYVAERALNEQAGKRLSPFQVRDKIFSVITHATQDERGPASAERLTSISAQAWIDAFPKLLRRAVTHIPLF